MPAAFVKHYRCPDELVAFGLAGELASSAAFFRLRDTLCYGRPLDRAPRTGVPDLAEFIACEPGRVNLPFDLSEVITNLQLERYVTMRAGLVERITRMHAIRSLYYLLRPLLGLQVRKHLQKISLKGWNRIPFPQWPVDFTVETLLEDTMRLVLESSGLERVPFIWFWPEGAPSCAIMTHDVEGQRGRDFCTRLMDLDDAYGVKSAFQIVPERRYDVNDAFLDEFRQRGFEINVHDLNHDGQLFRDRQQFMERAARINEYGKAFRSRGFRAGVMYRRQEWFDALDFAYDMSVPNVAHLEPQRGGCCTVMPYFIGDLLEMPLTTIQDYSLFHILGDYSISIWQTQINQILDRHGLISFITHPDYLDEERPRAVYEDLLVYLRYLKNERAVWMALPSDVERWWRSRSEMTLVRSGDAWRIEGPDCARARVAYAMLADDGIAYEIHGSRGEN
jgi:hypothetical protein